MPEEFPGREPTPLAGVSLTPVFAGEDVVSRPPIHLLFASDRGLRDGDWKLVSFRSQAWELYNMARDRAEVHNVAAAHPEIVARMAKQWHETMDRELLFGEGKSPPVADRASGHVHREWSNYSGKNGASTSSRAGGAAGKKVPAGKTGTGTR